MAREMKAWTEARELPGKVKFPTTTIELDLHQLMVFLDKVQDGGTNPLLMGARARLRGTRKEHMPINADEGFRLRVEEGWEWANRIIEALEMFTYIEEGEP